MAVTPETPSQNLLDSCVQILVATEEILTYLRDVFRGLAQGRDALTPEKAAAIATVIETARQVASAHVADCKRLHEVRPPYVM